MIPGAASRRRMLPRHGDAGEASALETDVVRFVAIVGLTLMVIFALVHSLPYEGLEATTEVELVRQTPPPPETNPAVITVPREELERLSRNEAELRNTERRLADSLAARRAVEHELDSLRVRVRNVTSELGATRKKLDDAHTDLAQLEAADAAEDERFKAEIEYLQDQVELLENDLRDAALETVRLEDQRIVVPVPPEVEAEPVPAGEIATGAAPGGRAARDAPDTLVLRFRDDRVYLDLLERGRITSYLRIPELDLTYQVFREAPERLRFSLVYGHDDGAIYEIPGRTVPEVLRSETRRFDVRLSLRNDLDYLVVLSAAIHDQVRSLEAAGEVGYYDILASERVVPAESP